MTLYKYSHLHAIALRTPAQAPGALMSHRVDSIPTRPPHLCLIGALSLLLNSRSVAMANHIRMQLRLLIAVHV